METNDHGFYGRWIVANGIAEAAGLGGVFILGFLLAPSMETRSEMTAMVGVALAAIAAGTVLEGGVVGLAQESVLRCHPAMTLRPYTWTIATMIGAGIAWIIGMLPSTILALTDHAGTASAEEPGVLIRYGLAIILGLIAGPILGLIAGPILGFAQALVLRPLTPRAMVWLWANALAWALGMPMIFAGMEFVQWDGRLADTIPAVVSVCGLAGLAVGAIHGWILVRILRPV